MTVIYHFCQPPSPITETGSQKRNISPSRAPSSTLYASHVFEILTMASEIPTPTPTAIVAPDPARAMACPSRTPYQ